MSHPCGFNNVRPCQGTSVFSHRKTATTTVCMLWFNFHPWFEFYFRLFFVMVMYDKESVNSLASSTSLLALEQQASVRVPVSEHIHRLKNYGKLRWRKFHDNLACEFTAPYTCRKVELHLKSATSNGFNFQIVNSLLES